MYIYVRVAMLACGDTRATRAGGGHTVSCQTERVPHRTGLGRGLYAVAVARAAPTRDRFLCEIKYM